MSIKSDIQTRSRVAPQQNSLRRSPRFLPPKNLNPKNSFQKSTFYNKSVEIHPESSSRSKEPASSRKISAAICGKSHRKRSRSKSGVVLEEANFPRRSPRLVSQQGMDVCKIRLGFPDGDQMRQSMSLASVSEENVKIRVENSRRSTRLASQQGMEVCKIRLGFPDGNQMRQSMSLASVSEENVKIRVGTSRRSPRLASQQGMEVCKIRLGFPDGNQMRQSMSLAPVSEENVKIRVEPSRRSPRLASQQGMEVCKIRLGFPDGNQMRQSMSSAPVSEEISKASDEVEDRKPLESEAITKSKAEIVPKKKSKPLSSQIRRSSSRLMNASNAVMKAGATEREEVAERFKDNRGELVLESRIEDGFVSSKETELRKANRRRMDDDNGVESRIEKLDDEECRGTVAWSNEQEEALRRAFLMAKPSPHFWKKVSKMVPGKSAQECFDKIHSSIVTPLSLPPRPRTKKKSLSPIPTFNLSTNIFPHISEIDAGRLNRCRTKKLAAQKTVRHLLRKHRLADQTKATDHFSLLESSPVNIPVNVLNDISNFSLLSPQSGEKLSANSKLFSRFKLFTTPEMDPSPQVLKQIKNRDLHDRYIDQLHYREARRLMLAKKSKIDDLDCRNYVSKPEHGALKAARTALISDAKSFISHFKHTVANSMDELNADCSDDDDKDIDVSDLDE